MRISRTWSRLAGGAAVAAAGVMALPSEKAVSAPAQSGALKLIDVSVGDFAGVFQNQIIKLTFSQPINPGSVNPATFQVRAMNKTRTGFAIQVPGSFQVTGAVVNFLPRLPTNLRDPADPNGGFYQVGTARDDAALNAGFQPNTNHQFMVVGSPSVAAVRSTNGRALAHTYKAPFITSGDSPKTDAFTTDTYQDVPPPSFKFSNPPDTVANVPDQYARHGGTKDVPSAIGVQLFGNKVPLSFSSVRQSGNVTLTLLSRHEDTSLRKAVQGTPFLEQNFDTVRMVFQPRLPLPDVGSFALRVTTGVKDLTEVFAFDNNAERLRLRQIYEFMVAARQNNPTVPPAQLADPPGYLITDWPDAGNDAGVAARGVLKTNVLLLGDSYPDEIDPRVMVLFSTRDELVTHATQTINFLKTENIFDATRSTAEWDQSVSSSASAIFTIAGGSAQLGDLSPISNTTLLATSQPGSTFNYRNISIPAGVTVKFTGSPFPVQPVPAVNPPLQANPSPPLTIKCLSFQLDGQLAVDGTPGVAGATNSNYTSNTTTPVPGGPGGPGGGNGGLSVPNLVTASQRQGTGGVGNDVNLVPATTITGGQGGQGGAACSGTVYCYSGGGGGGGSRIAGQPGLSGTFPSYATWNGTLGTGGAAATGNSNLATLLGGAGGGSGGNGNAYNYIYAWGQNGGTGGGGGGALLLQSAGTINIGTSGIIHARGGVGGAGGYSSYNYENGGGGGGGGGGSVLLRTSKGYNITNPPAAIDVAGGAGGAATATYAGAGGSGGAGFVRLEDPNGAISVPGATQGTYSPVGGGVSSYVYSKFIDLGVDQPKWVNFTSNDFQITAGNDAVLVELQAAIENPAVLGTPLTTAINAAENSTNTAQVSNWLPVRLLDNSSTGKLITVPGNSLTDVVFPIDVALNGKNYRFFRIRITFQLDSTQTVSSPVPFVDQMIIHYDFNF